MSLLKILPPRFAKERDYPREKRSRESQGEDRRNPENQQGSKNLDGKSRELGPESTIVILI
jgi:hypothetical protein